MDIFADLVLSSLTILTTASVILFEYRRTKDLVTPLHLAWVFFGYFFLISYFYMGVYGSDAQLHPFDTPEATAITALFQLFVGFCFLTLGYYSSLPHSLASRTVKQLPKEDLSPRLARVIGLTLFALGFVSTVVFITKNGGIRKLLSARNIFVFRVANNSLRYWLGLQIGLFTGLALYFSGARYTSRHFRAYILGGFTVALFFVMHTRMRALFGVLLIGLYAWYVDDRVTVHRLVIIGAISLFALGLFRPIEMMLQGYPIDRVLQVIYGYIFIEPGGLFVYPDYFQAYMALIEGVPSRVPFQWGRTLIGVPWLPFNLFEQMRAMATDPTELTEIAVYGYDRPDTGVIAGGFGVLYLNFSLPGVFLGATVIGIVFRWAYIVWRQTGKNIMVGALYFAVMYYFFIMLAKKPIVFNVLLVLMALLGTWFIGVFARHGTVQSVWKKSQSRRLWRSTFQSYSTLKDPFLLYLKQSWKRSIARAFVLRVLRIWKQSTVHLVISLVIQGWKASRTKDFVEHGL